MSHDLPDLFLRTPLTTLETVEVNEQAVNATIGDLGQLTRHHV